MASYVGKADDEFSVSEGLPVKVVTPSVISRLIPTGNLEPCNFGQFLWQERLLDGARDL